MPGIKLGAESTTLARLHAYTTLNILPVLRPATLGEGAANSLGRSALYWELLGDPGYGMACVPVSSSSPPHDPLRS